MCTYEDTKTRAFLLKSKVQHVHKPFITTKLKKLNNCCENFLLPISEKGEIIRFGSFSYSNCQPQVEHKLVPRNIIMQICNLLMKCSHFRFGSFSFPFHRGKKKGERRVPSPSHRLVAYFVSGYYFCDLSFMDYHKCIKY